MLEVLRYYGRERVKAKVVQAGYLKEKTLSLAIKTDEAKNTLSLFVDGIVDLLAHRHSLISPLIDAESIRFWSVEDVIPMKLGAVSGRGAKKDFGDLSELLNHFSLVEMLGFFRAKYANSDPG